MEQKVQGFEYFKFLQNYFSGRYYLLITVGCEIAAVAYSMWVSHSCLQLTTAKHFYIVF